LVVALPASPLAEPVTVPVRGTKLGRVTVWLVMLVFGRVIAGVLDAPGNTVVRGPRFIVIGRLGPAENCGRVMLGETPANDWVPMVGREMVAGREIVAGRVVGT
jgi:hypothetical protein